MTNKFVYVFSDGEFYKIGVSKNPIQRAEQIKFATKNRISVLMTINCKDAYGCEKYLHNKYKDFNVGGEWFSFEDESFIDEVYRVCKNNIVSKENFICLDSKLNQKSPELENLVENNCVLLYADVDRALDGKYNRVVLPHMLKSLGCIRVEKNLTKFYITPNGIEKGLDKAGYKTLIQFIN